MTNSITVKDKILELLKKEKNLTIPELLTHFSMTDIALRRHLKNLENEGLIKSFVIKQSIGRPYFEYRLTKNGDNLFPNHYQQLSLGLLEELEKLEGRAFVEQLIKNWTNKMASTHADELAQMNSLDQRIDRLLQIQEQKGYMAILEENNGEYIIKQYNCPIYEVACNYTSICQEEMKVFKKILGGKEVTLHQCMAEGENCCSFAVAKK